MDIKLWKINDSLQCQQLTAEYLDEAQDILRDAFFRHENVCRVVEVGDDIDAMEELKGLTLASAKDGVSIIALDTSRNKVVGFAFNKLQVKDGPGFEKIAKSWKRPAARAVTEFMTEIDNICNLFDHCKIDCLMEIMFVGTLPEYRGKGIASRLVGASLEIGTCLKNGINIKKSIDGTQLGLEPIPKIASAIYTSIYTQKIGKKFGFNIVVEKNYDEFTKNGKRFSDVLGSHTSTVTLEYKVL